MLLRRVILSQRHRKNRGVEQSALTGRPGYNYLSTPMPAVVCLDFHSLAIAIARVRSYPDIDRIHHSNGHPYDVDIHFHVLIIN